MGVSEGEDRIRIFLQTMANIQDTMGDIILREQAEVVGKAVGLMYSGVTSIGLPARMRQHRVT